jgi:hypothetical protein
VAWWHNFVLSCVWSSTADQCARVKPSHTVALLQRSSLTYAGGKHHACTGYGSIEYSPADESRPDVEGVLHDLSEREMRRLAFTEGGYDVRDVLVETADDVTVQAKAFKSNWTVRLFHETQPTRLYIRKICSGAADFGLSAAYQVCLDTLTCTHVCCCVQHRVFVIPVE